MTPEDIFRSAVPPLAGISAGWLLWQEAASGGRDPYDSGTSLWGAIGAAVLIGAIAQSRVLAILSSTVLIVYPVISTFDLAERDHSPFGPLGVVFLFGLLPVLFALTIAGWVTREKLKALLVATERKQ